MTISCGTKLSVEKYCGAASTETTFHEADGALCFLGVDIRCNGQRKIKSQSMHYV